MYEPVLVDEKSDLYNVYEVHENYRILAMAVNVPLQVAEEICHILNEFQIKTLQPCPKCGHSVIIRQNVMGGVCYEDALNYLQKDCVAVIKEQE